MSSAEPPDPAAGRRPGRRGFVFPSALTVLVLVTLAVWLLAFLIPSGAYDRDRDGAPVQGTYHRVDAELSFLDRLNDLFLAPVNGLYGIRGEDGTVAPDLTGELYGAAGVFLYVLAIGAFITMVFATGALNHGIERLAHRLRNRSSLLIVAIMLVFAVLGTVSGFAEETLGFYGLVVPLMLALGYDRMTALGVTVLGAGVGVLTSTVNPFATGVASSAADISLGDGIVLRFVMWLTLTAVTVTHVLLYARRVRRDPERSLSGFRSGDRELAAESRREVPPLTGVERAVLATMVLVFAFMIFAVVPWSAALTGDADAEPYGFELGWYFPQLAAMFLVAAVLVGVIARMGEQRVSETVVRGAADFVAPALVVVLARGVTVIMNNAMITDTVLHGVEGVVKGTSSGIFAILVFVVNLPLAFLIPSTSGHATLAMPIIRWPTSPVSRGRWPSPPGRRPADDRHATLAMPIIAPLADFAGVPRAVAVTAWQASSGIMNLWVPTSAVIMGGCALAKVGYNRYIRFVLPLLALLFVLICLFLAVGATIS